MKMNLGMTVAVATLLLFGCSTEQPKLDTSDTTIQNLDGKSYNIPKGAHISPYVDEKVIQFYRGLGLNECNEGDIIWEDASARDEINLAIGKGDKGIYKKLADQSRIGCATALN